MSKPWRNWYHAMGNTWGTWLPGDERGWRSWRHAEHCEGDYKSPPPRGAHDERLQRSRRAMNRPPVLLESDERMIAANAMGERLRALGAEVVDLCVTKTHFHVLVRFLPVQSSATAVALLYEKLRLVKGNQLEDGRDPLPRHVIGLAKKHASFALRESGFAHAGGVWTAKCKIEPVRDRAHQVNIAKYIRGHAQQGGAVLSIIAPDLLARVEK